MTDSGQIAIESDHLSGPKWGVGYRAVFPVQGHMNPIDVAQRHVRAWLSEKLGGIGRLDDWDGASSQVFDSRYSISTVDISDSTSGTSRRLYRLTDSNTAGTFAVALYASQPARRNGLLVVEASQANVSGDAAVDAVGTPRLVRDLIDEVQPRDGATDLTSSPQFIRRADVDVVVDAVTDAARIGSVIVACSPALDVDAAWAEIVAKLTRNSVGVAATFVIAGDAVDDFNRLLPTSHQTPLGSVRTYAAGVDLESPADARVHRFLGPSTLARSVHGRAVTGKLPAIHARGPRLRLLERSLPADVRRTIDLLDRAERRQRLEREVALEAAQTSASAVPIFTTETGSSGASPDTRAPFSSSLAAIRRVVNKWLGRAEPDESDIDALDTFISKRVAEAKVARGYVEEVETENDRLHKEIDSLRTQLDDRDFDIALSADELRSVERDNYTLRSRLRELHQFVIPTDDQEWAPPADVEELVARITPGPDAHRALAFVEFTGDSDTVAELRKRDPYGKYANDLWDYVRVLFEYAELRHSGTFTGSVYMYLEQDDVDGFKCSPQRHAAKESDSVLRNAKWRSERVFPVPSAVDPAERMLMEAHFRPTHRDQFAPRMYYLDDISVSGKIYVGYIGRHLSNTKTS